jgi:hypothetical protein
MAVVDLRIGLLPVLSIKPSLKAAGTVTADVRSLAMLPGKEADGRPYNTRADANRGWSAGFRWGETQDQGRCVPVQQHGGALLEAS